LAPIVTAVATLSASPVGLALFGGAVVGGAGYLAYKHFFGGKEAPGLTGSTLVPGGSDTYKAIMLGARDGVLAAFQQMLNDKTLGTGGGLGGTR
jgi:hypothetical protein